MGLFTHHMAHARKTKRPKVNRARTYPETERVSSSHYVPRVTLLSLVPQREHGSTALPKLKRRSVHDIPFGVICCVEGEKKKKDARLGGACEVFGCERAFV